MQFWNLVLLNPIMNLLVVLSAILHSFGLAIMALTFIIRMAIMPVTQWQMRANQRMSESRKSIEPFLAKLKKKYGKDPPRLQQESMKLYKEAGITARGCLLNPMLAALAIQLPIVLALSRAVRFLDAATPQDFLGLSQHLYSWSIVSQSLPVSVHFLWLDLSRTDPYFVLPLLVTAATLVSQRMLAQPTSDPSQRSMQMVTGIGLPLLFGFLTATLPAGLGLYLLIVSLVGIATAYYAYGWGHFFPQPHVRPSSAGK